MKKRFWTSCILALFISWNGAPLFAQNLFPNPSFENWDGTSGSGGNSLGGLDNWYNANGTSDHHHTSISGNNLTGLSPCPLGQGNTECGYPVEGEAVLGCWKGNGIDGTREWAGVQLIQPMQIGSCYKVSFWIQNKEDSPNSLYETNQWGIFFSETQLPTFGVNVIDYTSRLDQIVMTEEVVNDTIWHYFEFDFQANDAYQYAFVGYQGNVSSSTFTSANNDPFLGFYVWFDQVSIIEITPELSVSNDAGICPGDSVLISASSNFPVIWDHLGPDTISSFWVTPQTTTSYYVRTQDNTDCTRLDSVVVTVDQGELVNYPDPDIICLGTEPFVLDTNTNDGYWLGTGIVDSITSLFDPDIAGSGTHEIYYLSNNDCSENFTYLLEVFDTPVLDFDADVYAGCAPLEINFSENTPILGTSYVWDFGNGSTSNDIGFTSTLYTDSGNYDVGLFVNYSDHCSASISLNDFIQVANTPTADFAYSQIQDPTLNAGVQFENLSSSNLSNLLWDFGDGNSNSQLDPFYEYQNPGIYEVQLTVTANGICQDSISQSIIINNQVDFYVPNVFSPNGDGINDYFEISVLGILESFQVTIFNRWGDVLFRSNNRGEPWDGYAKGKLVSEGVYIYLVEYQASDFINGGSQSGKFSGDITVVK